MRNLHATADARNRVRLLNAGALKYLRPDEDLEPTGLADEPGSDPLDAWSCEQASAADEAFRVARMLVLALGCIGCVLLVAWAVAWAVLHG